MSKLTKEDRSWATTVSRVFPEFKADFSSTALDFQKYKVLEIFDLFLG